MASFQVKGHVGEDGLLILHVPTSFREIDVEALLVLKPIDDAVKSSGTDALGWPADFFSKIVGSISDDTFQRGPQGEYEVREEL